MATPDYKPDSFFNKAPSVHLRAPKAVSEADRTEWQRRVDSYDQALSRTRGRRRTVECPDCGGGEERTCLDYRPQSETRVTHAETPTWSTFPTRSGAEWQLNTPHPTLPGASPLAKVANRIRIFPSGELEVRTVSRQSNAKPPTPAYGPRYSRNVSGNGRRVIRRSVNALVQRESCQVALYTLSSREMMPDELWNKRLHAFLAWGRKYLPYHFKHYVLVNQLQARGTLHAHLLLFKRVPKGLWRRMRDLWANHYEMGPGSFDTKTIRSPARAAAYLTRYVTKDSSGNFRVGLDASGMLTFEPWAVGRNGQPYERVAFRGNAYRVSAALRLLARPIAEYHVPWGSDIALKLSCNLKGGVQFWPSVSSALWWVSENLPRPPNPQTMMATAKIELWMTTRMSAI